LFSLANTGPIELKRSAKKYQKFWQEMQFKR